MLHQLFENIPALLRKFGSRLVIQILLVASAFSTVPLMALVGVSYRGSLLGALSLATVFAICGWLFVALYSILGYKLIGWDTSQHIHVNTFVFYLFAPLFLKVVTTYSLAKLTTSGLASIFIGGFVLFALSLLSFLHADREEKDHPEGSNQMDVDNIVAELTAKYPGKPIIKLPEDNPTEIIVELERTAEMSCAIAVIARSVEHHHQIMVETYTVLRGRISVFLDGREHKLETGAMVIIPPGTKHWAQGDSAWVQVDCTPPWSAEDHILDS